MIRRPLPAEWDTSQLSLDRRAYLDDGLSFEEIVAGLFTEMQVTCATIQPYRTPAASEPRDARQVVFVFSTSKEACDLLYNAADGLRARYWQSPDHGFEATRHLIDRLLPALISFVDHNPPIPIGRVTSMTSRDIQASLEAPSAKVWPRERDDDDNLLFVEHQLVVPRWLENEQYASINKGMWRRTPNGGELEIKGAILGKDGTEYLPEGKRDRSYQIHRFGFT